MQKGIDGARGFRRRPRRPWRKGPTQTMQFPEGEKVLLIQHRMRAKAFRQHQGVGISIMLKAEKMAVFMPSHLVHFFRGHRRRERPLDGYFSLEVRCAFGKDAHRFFNCQFVTDFSLKIVRRIVPAWRDSSTASSGLAPWPVPARGVAVGSGSRRSSRRITRRCGSNS